LVQRAGRRSKAAASRETPDRDRRAGACTIIGSACLDGRHVALTHPAPSLTEQLAGGRSIHPSGTPQQRLHHAEFLWTHGKLEQKKNPPLITDHDPNGPSHPWGLGQADRSCPFGSSVPVSRHAGSNDRCALPLSLSRYSTHTQWQCLSLSHAAMRSGWPLGPAIFTRTHCLRELYELVGHPLSGRSFPSPRGRLGATARGRGGKVCMG